MTPLTLVYPRGRHPWHVFFFSVRSGWLASDVATLTLPEGCSWESCHFNAGDVAPWFPSVFFLSEKDACIKRERTPHRLWKSLFELKLEPKFRGRHQSKHKNNP